MSEETEFPEGIVAKLLNSPVVVHPRMGETAQTLPYVHVSDLLKNKKDNQFCIREHVLRHYDKPIRAKGTVPPKMGLLWDTGNLIGDNIVIKKLIKSGRFGQLVWGDWTCDGCDAVAATFEYKPECCPSCGSKNMTYKEVDLREDDVRLVGHPDLIIRLKDGTLIVYEIKTIDRQDIAFDPTSTNDGALLTQALGDHHLQASYYFYLLKKRGYKVSKRIRFIYVDRDLANMYREKPYLEFVEDVMPVERCQKGIDTCKNARDAIQNRTLPDRICDTPTCTRSAKCTTVASCFARRLNVILPPTSQDSMSPSPAQGSTSKASGAGKRKTSSTTLSRPTAKAAQTTTGRKPSLKRSSKT